jgi:hypothetical protein
MHLFYTGMQILSLLFCSALGQICAWARFHLNCVNVSCSYPSLLLSMLLLLPLACSIAISCFSFSAKPLFKNLTTKTHLYQAISITAFVLLTDILCTLVADDNYHFLFCWFLKEKTAISVKIVIFVRAGKDDHLIFDRE